MVYMLHFCAVALWGCSALLVAAESIDGIKSLADRLLHGHGDDFKFSLTSQHEPWSRWNVPENDEYTVKACDGRKICIEGSTLSALARGLRHYSTDMLQLDEFWFVTGHTSIPKSLPPPKATLTGGSVVPWRYNLNTVTFSYSLVWYSWEDWEKLLDWAALRGTNLHLAWVGYEKIFLDSFRDFGLTDDEILAFFSGPAFQAWNRFGNIQGSWGGVGNLTLSWIDAQFELQKKIVARMAELGITPILPAFTGFVPEAFKRVYPNANITQASAWSGVPDEYTEDTFLSPLDDSYAKLQKSFISKQIDAFGNITNVYTLDQFNEMTPASWEISYLSSVSTSTYDALSEANPAAIWLLQGWLFYNEESEWTQDRIDAYLGGAEGNDSMLVLDLYSEDQPQWQRTKSYAGRPWIWCELHDFGGNMGLFGQIENVTVSFIEALQDSDSLVGVGLTPEGYEGNEVMYDLLLDQAWSSTAIDTRKYFYDWVTLRYAGGGRIPASLYQAWEILREQVYNVTDPAVPCVGVGVYQLFPSLTGLLNRTGHYPPPTAIPYDQKLLVQAWSLMIAAAVQERSMWSVPAFQLDLVDVTRQVMSNSFNDIYSDLVQSFQSAMKACKNPRDSKCSQASKGISEKGQYLLDFLTALDGVLSTNGHFTLEAWLDKARYWASITGGEDLLEFNARSQVTVWQLDASGLNDYAAKEWSGLTGSYYRGRWSIFVAALVTATHTGSLNETAMNDAIAAFEKSWQYDGVATTSKSSLPVNSIEHAIAKIAKEYPGLFSTEHQRV